MNPQLPPLNPLRVFESAARHLSFTEAAAELHITPGAVSHQVKALETWLGFALFDRTERPPRLTRGGEVYAKGSASRSGRSCAPRRSWCRRARRRY